MYEFTIDVCAVIKARDAIYIFLWYVIIVWCVVLYAFLFSFQDFLLFLMEIERIFAQKPYVFIAFLRGRAPELKTICFHSFVAPREVAPRNIINTKRIFDDFDGYRRNLDQKT